jgi:hypothetical protein
VGATRARLALRALAAVWGLAVLYVFYRFSVLAYASRALSADEVGGIFSSLDDKNEVQGSICRRETVSQ